MPITGKLPTDKSWVRSNTLSSSTYLILGTLEWLSTVATFFSHIITLLKGFPKVETIFQSDYPTWINTLRFALMRSYLFAEVDSIQGHCAQTTKIWVDFGKALGYDERRAQESVLVCAYPRCAIPNVVANLATCGACGNEFYCSIQCQERSEHLPRN